VEGCFVDECLVEGHFVEGCFVLAPNLYTFFITFYEDDTLLFF
jgi:hypothetical protein